MRTMLQPHLEARSLCKKGGRRRRLWESASSRRARDDRVGGAGRFVEQRHLTEHLARAEHGEGLFTHAAHFTADPHAAVQDEVELVADVAVLEDLAAQGVRFVGRDFRDQVQSFRLQAGESSTFELLARSLMSAILVAKRREWAVSQRLKRTVHGGSSASRRCRPDRIRVVPHAERALGAARRSRSGAFKTCTLFARPSD